jgi:hypothetical protein
VDSVGTTVTRVTDWRGDWITSWHDVRNAALGGESVSAVRQYVLLGGVGTFGCVEWLETAFTSLEYRNIKQRITPFCMTCQIILNLDVTIEGCW